MIVDIHSHLFPPAWAGSGQLPRDMFDVEVVLQRQAEAGIDTTIVSDPHIWYGDRDLGDIANVRAYNDFAAGLSRDNPSICALATANPWRGDEHVSEVERAVTELGLVGVALPTSDQGRYLDAVPHEFWDVVQGLAVPVFLHPAGAVIGQEHMGEYRLGEVCGRPLDTTLTLARFILTGTFARHESLRVVCSHAGGAITMIADRLDFGHELREYAPFGPWGPVSLDEPPSRYVRRLYLDTVTYGTEPLRLALRTVGPDRLCFGTDGPPVPFAASRMMRVVQNLDLDHAAVESVLGGNAASLFGLVPGKEAGNRTC